MNGFFPHQLLSFHVEAEENRLQLFPNEDGGVSFSGPKSFHDWLEAYLAGSHLPSPIHQRYPTAYGNVFLEKLMDISLGETITYGSLASHMGIPGAARAVGSFCRVNSFPLIYPCHRVLPASGGFGNYAFGSSLKAQLLAFEKSIAHTK